MFWPRNEGWRKKCRKEGERQEERQEGRKEECNKEGRKGEGGIETRREGRKEKPILWVQQSICLASEEQL